MQNVGVFRNIYSVDTKSTEIFTFIYIYIYYFYVMSLLCLVFQSSPLLSAIVFKLIVISGLFDDYLKTPMSLKT